MVGCGTLELGPPPLAVWMAVVHPMSFVFLLQANVIHGKGVEKLQDMQFQRTARTDKGVHAARQVVSLKMGVPENVEDKINEHLPKDMRSGTLLL